MNYSLLVTLFFLHWFADFLLQTRWMANNKSKSFAALTSHVLVYTAALSIGVIFYSAVVSKPFRLESVALFAFSNFFLHFFTDMITSRCTSYFWKKQDVHKFFAVIGFDQFIHQTCLLVTMGAFLA